MRPGSVFVSYRRDDSAGYARALADRLAQRYGAARVFVDVEDIAAGEPFADVIGRALEASAVVLVLIGPRWRGERPDGTARIDQADDVVRHEVAAALRAPGRVVIPVLLDGTRMPSAAALPDDLRDLAARNAVELGATRFEADLARLLAGVDAALGMAPEKAALRRRRAVAVAAALIAVTGGAWVALHRAPSRVPAPAVATGAARPAIDGAWVAEVVYDWPDARHAERFDFRGEGTALRGSASFLGVPRGIEDGRVDADGLTFTTRSIEALGDAQRETVHRYRAARVGDALRFSMQTEGAATPHVPVDFTARRAP